VPAFLMKTNRTGVKRSCYCNWLCREHVLRLASFTGALVVAALDPAPDISAANAPFGPAGSPKVASSAPEQDSVSQA